MLYITYMETELTKLEKQVLTEAREYCKKHGLVLYKYLSKGIRKQLEGDLKNDN